MVFKFLTVHDYDGNANKCEELTIYIWDSDLSNVCKYDGNYKQKDEEQTW